MRERCYWQDHVVSNTGEFLVKATSIEDVYRISPYGTVMQQGTFQDAKHFNSFEESLVAHEIAIGLLQNSIRLNQWRADDEYAKLANLNLSVERLHTVETGTVTLTNTLRFPFNNSKKTIPLSTRHDNTNYVVVVEVSSFKGNVGEVVVSEQLTNGFKLEHTGSASSVTINYKVIGGWNA